MKIFIIASYRKYVTMHPSWIRVWFKKKSYVWYHNCDFTKEYYEWLCDKSAYFMRYRRGANASLMDRTRRKVRFSHIRSNSHYSFYWRQSTLIKSSGFNLNEMKSLSSGYIYVHMCTSDGNIYAWFSMNKYKSINSSTYRYLLAKIQFVHLSNYSCKALAIFSIINDTIEYMDADTVM